MSSPHPSHPSHPAPPVPTLNPYAESTLYTSPSAREKWDNAANLYSLILSLDALERAYVSQSIQSEGVYEEVCGRLLAQARTGVKLVAAGAGAGTHARGGGGPGAAAAAAAAAGRGAAGGAPPPGAGAGAGAEDPPPAADVEDFMRTWGLDLPLASHRLLVGIPATLEHPTSSSASGGGASAPPGSASAAAMGGTAGGGGGGGGGSAGERAKNVAETTQAFITLMDALKLSLRAKDQLHPLLGEAVSCWTRSGGAGGGDDEAGGQGGAGGRRAKLVAWLIKLNQLKASDEVDEDEARQMLFDIEGAYQAFFRSLQGN